MSKFKYSLIGLIGLLLFTACEADGPAIDDHYLNYPIPEFQAVTHDYQVGVEYLYTVSGYGSSQTVMDLFTTPPVVGRYSDIREMTPDGSERIMDTHLRWINQAKIDYLLLSCRPQYMTATPPSSSYSSDSLYIEEILSSPQIGNLKFALKFDVSTTLLGTDAPGKSDSSMIVEKKMAGDITAADAMIKDLIESMGVFYKHERMFKIGGKPVVYITNAYRIYSGDAVVFYARLRQEVKQATGYDLYIIGQQERWSPPARYEYLLKNTVDAIYHSRYAEIDTNDFNRVYTFHPLADQNWKYSKKWFNTWGTDYVPNISPGWNSNLGSENPISPYYSPFIVRTEEFFNKFCTVAKWNADKHNLILISSWNYWHYDSQIEPSEGYGTAYLDIIKKQFKVNP